MADSTTVAAVLFPGFELLDVFGPLEAFGMLAEAGKCQVVTVGQDGGVIASRQGPRTATDYSFADCPQIQIMRRKDLSG